MNRSNTSRRDFLKTLGLGAAAMAGASCATTGPLLGLGGGRRPNILYIMTDDHASHAMSCYGSVINKTPNLDRVAEGGMRFDNAFCTNSICAPCRAVVLTGKHSHINGVINNDRRFDGAQQTFPKLLQQAGYQTAMIGKWHLKTDPTGFDYWNVLPGQGLYYNPDLIEMGQRKKHEGYVTDIITDFALDWLKEGRDRSKPFCLMFHHKAPHREWEPGPKHLTLYDGADLPEPDDLFDDYAGRGAAAREQDMSIEKTMNARDLKLTAPKNLTPAQKSKWDEAYDPKNAAFAAAKLEGKALVRWKYQRYIKDYLRCIASVDDNVGRVLDYLDEAGLTRDTIVVYTSDQGFYLGDHGWFDKRFIYEESLRMPLLVRYPRGVKPGAVNADLVQNLDFAETFLDYAGVPVPPDMQGRSLRPLLRGKTPKDWREAVYYHYHEYPAVHSVKRHYGLRTQRYKLVHFYYDIDEWELYDLEKDPGEKRSVYGDPAYADVQKELHAELERLREFYQDNIGLESLPKPPKGFAAATNAKVQESAFGYDIEAGGQGLALIETPRAFKKKARFSCKLKSLSREGSRNGLIAFGSGTNAKDLVKCGVYIGAGQYIIQHGGFGDDAQTVRTPAKFDKNKTFDVAVEVDLEAKQIKLTVDGTTVTEPLKKNWREIKFAGYYLNSTATAFSKLEISGE